MNEFQQLLQMLENFRDEVSQSFLHVHEKLDAMSCRNGSQDMDIGVLKSRQENLQREIEEFKTVTRQDNHEKADSKFKIINAASNIISIVSALIAVAAGVAVLMLIKGGLL